jgi:hypothetical protein
MPGINKNTPQTHADILRVIGQAQVSGKGLDVKKDGTVKVASLGTRAFRVIGQKLKGTAWAEEKVQSKLGPNVKVLGHIDTSVAKLPLHSGWHRWPELTAKLTNHLLIH